MAQLIYHPTMEAPCTDCAQVGRTIEAQYRLYYIRTQVKVCFVHACARKPITDVRKAEATHRRNQRYLDSIV